MTDDELEQALRYQHDVGFDEGYEVGYEDGCQATLGKTCHAEVGDGSGLVPKHWTGCSRCGCVWDYFYNNMAFMGPPEYCPRCGARVTEDK